MIFNVLNVERRDDKSYRYEPIIIIIIIIRNYLYFFFLLLKYHHGYIYLKSLSKSDLYYVTYVLRQKELDYFYNQVEIKYKLWCLSWNTYKYSFLYLCVTSRNIIQVKLFSNVHIEKKSLRGKMSFLFASSPKYW